MPRYRKRPVEIDAVKLNGLSDDDEILETYDHLTLQLGMSPDEFKITSTPRGVKIHTLEGLMLASPGDYVIRGVKGEFYPCKPDIFEMTYDKIGD